MDTNVVNLFDAVGSEKELAGEIFVFGHVGNVGELAVFTYCSAIVKKAEGMSIGPDPGTYAIVLKNNSCTEVRVGRLGRISIEPGHYVYVGSAFGPGGLRARVSWHLREKKTKRWHIDYLRQVAIPVSVWCSYEPRNLEHQWARAVGELLGTSGIKRFGSSDCSCSTHLFFSKTQPDFTRFSRAVGGAVEMWPTL